MSFYGNYLEESKIGFAVEFTNFVAMHEYVGKELVFQYRMQLVETNTDTNVFKNKARLVTNFEELEDEVEINTGGKHFIKVDVDETRRLAGAQFHIHNDKEQYLSKSDGSYTWIEDADDERLVILESDSNGVFEVNGLTYGDYFLQEIVAPEGYELNGKPICFTVTADSYTARSVAALKVVNLKTPIRAELPKTLGPKTQTPTPEKLTPDVSTVQTSTPTKSTKQVTRTSLPRTKDLKNGHFIWLGVALIANVIFVFLWKYKG